jgi:hypothetical protein
LNIKKHERRNELMKEKGEEKMVLSHEPVPGYRKIFVIVFMIAAVYLAIILLQTL